MLISMHIDTSSIMYVYKMMWQIKKTIEECQETDVISIEELQIQKYCIL